MKVYVLIASAGSGKRLGKGVEKPYRILNGQPIIARTLKKFSGFSSIDKIILIVEKAKIKTAKGLIKKFKIKKIFDVVAGGKTRQQSVFNGLKILPRECDIVLIHDGARPFVSERIVNDVIKCAGVSGAAIAAVKAKDTIKEVDENGFVKKTLDRKKLWQIQTPQGFRRDLILNAYAKNKNCLNENITDDGMLVEKTGKKVKVVEGDYKNIKITTNDDLIIAECFSKNEV